MGELRFLPGLLNAMRRSATLDRIYLLHTRPPRCGDDDCVDNHG